MSKGEDPDSRSPELLGPSITQCPHGLDHTHKPAKDGPSIAQGPTKLHQPTHKAPPGWTSQRQHGQGRICPS